MKKSDLILMSLGNLFRRKMRTVLTLLGVIIGTTSIIIMVSLGVGMKQNITKQLKDWGSLNIINVQKRYDFRKDQPGAGSKKKLLLNEEAVKMMEEIPGVTVVSPVKYMSVMLRKGKFYAYASVKAMKKELLEKQNVKLSQGSFYSDTEKNTFVFGGEVPYSFQDPRKRVYSQGFMDFDMDYEMGYRMNQQERPAPNVDVMDGKVLLNPDTRYGQPKLSHEEKATIPLPIKIQVTGIIKPGNWQFDSDIFTSLETFDKIEADYKKWQKKMQSQSQSQMQGEFAIPIAKEDKRKKEYNSVQIFVEDMEQIEAVQASVREMGFEAYSMIEMVKQASGFADIAQLVLAGIGAVSLIVAAIGISNTMVMSIYERTKEIGVMKVIGASLGDIQGMFLAEAALIGLIGGIIGLIFSTGGSYLINFLTAGVDLFGSGMSGEAPGKLSVIPLWLYLLGMVFTTGVGLLSGYLPARRAMKLSVLKALRNE